MNCQPYLLKLFISTKRKKVPLMATKLYTIENLLVGKEYRSRSRHFNGEIVSATPRPEIWYGDNTEAYLIEINIRTLRNKFATIAVKVGE
jgi:hypothetical protein